LDVTLFIIVRYSADETHLILSANGVVTNRVHMNFSQSLLRTCNSETVRRWEWTFCRGHARGDTIISSRDVLLGLKRTKRLMMFTRRKQLLQKRLFLYVSFSFIFYSCCTMLI